jgi:cytochrome b
MLNLFLPGIGLIYLGRRWSGGLLAAAFLACCGAAAWWLVRGMARYYQAATSDAILQEGVLEQLKGAFPVGRLVVLAILTLVLQAVAVGWFEVAVRRQGTPPETGPR